MFIGREGRRGGEKGREWKWGKGTEEQRWEGREGKRSVGKNVEKL